MSATTMYGKRALPILLLFASFCTQATATTVFSDEPGSCKIIGDADVYGLGIRIGLYMQWAAVILAYIISPSSGTSIRTASNTLYFAVLINTMYGALTKSDDILVLEWFLARLLTFWLLIYNFPLTTWLIVSQLGSVAVLCILAYSSAVIDMWIYWKRFDQGLKTGCTVQLFIFKAFDMTDHAWVTYSRVMGIIFCIGLPFLFIELIVIIGQGLTVDPVAVLEEAQKEGANPRKGPSKAIRILACFVVVVCGIVTIVFLEKTLRANDIEFPDFDLLSSGQLIPMMVGVASMVSVLWQAAQRYVSRAMN